MIKALIAWGIGFASPSYIVTHGLAIGSPVGPPGGNQGIQRIFTPAYEPQGSAGTTRVFNT